MSNQEVLKKYLIGYYNIARKQYFLLKNIIDTEYLDEKILSLFNEKSSEYRRLIDEYQKWIFLLIEQHNCDKNNKYTLYIINKIFDQNINLSCIVQLKLKKYIIFLKNLLENTKDIQKISPPYYRYTFENTYLDLNA